MKALISGMLIILITGCGGSEATGTVSQCTAVYEYSNFGPCQNGIETRVVISQTASPAGCLTPENAPVLTVACKLSCPAEAPLACATSTVTMCCPSATPFYCKGLNVCQAVAAGGLCGTEMPWPCK